MLKLLLSSHVVFGVLGIAAFYAVLLQLLKQKRSIRFLKISSISGVILLVLSWLTGGYYYATYYGKAVRAVIKAGKYSWAHTVFMEAKEHIFLFLPFLAVVVAIVLHTQAYRLETDARLKKQLTWLTGILVVLGIIITLAGAIISGAVR